MKIIDEYKTEYDIPDKILKKIYNEEFKNITIPKCFGEYPSQIVLKTNKRKKEKLSESEYRKKIQRELKKFEKCILKCKYKNKCCFTSLLNELRILNSTAENC